MGEKADLEKQAIEALEHYREAFAKAVELEKEEAAARREVFKRLNHFEIANAKNHGTAVKPEIIQAGQAAISRLNEIRIALSKATETLDSAYRALIAFDEALGYIPVPGTATPDTIDAANDPEESAGSV